MLGYLSLDIICSLELTEQLLRTDNVRGQISVHIFAPNGGYCLYIKTQYSTETFFLFYHTLAQIYMTNQNHLRIM